MKGDVKISQTGYVGIMGGLLIAAYGAFQLPLPMLWGTVTFIGAVVAGLCAIALHEHEE